MALATEVPAVGAPVQAAWWMYVIDPQKAREAMKLVRVPPNPLGMVLMLTLPSVNVVGVPVTHDM